jgi:hypothetical protein
MAVHKPAPESNLRTALDRLEDEIGELEAMSAAMRLFMANAPDRDASTTFHQGSWYFYEALERHIAKLNDVVSTFYEERKRGTA